MSARLLRLALLAVLLPAGAAFATVNVNSAQQSELQRVKGLDKFKAKQIIDYRAQYGEFRSVDDLGKLLGQDTVQAVRPQLTVSGDPYVPPAKPEKKKAGKKGDT
jgi:competence protein ComEA